ncbi:MAG TPA: glycine betaine ABC transporter substrate-binding protein [Candidatus Baltobacteraceae bacterium]|nr:glycine betaine ABC transporter substrate-binding protein [Candidatus Baltobacteraceae bacterium]
MSRVARATALKLIGAALALPACSTTSARALRVGSTDSSENVVIAEIYAGALERSGIRIARRLRSGDDAALTAALERGEVDLFPAHTRSRAPRTGLVWLAPAPVDDVPCLVTSQYAAEEYYMLVLSSCAAIAPRLRLAATHDFLASGALEGLRRRYGGFKFGKVVACDPGEQYDALNRGDVAVANGIATDPKIAESQILVLGDDMHFWPRNNVVPVMSAAASRAFPHAPRVLDRVSRELTQYAVQQMNAHLDLLSLEPSDVAEDFLRAHRT